ncbi:MFS family permease [Agromyces terreus]|uniref:MFS family permease n=1 Tax=Agromyces terreus TaxID=424795 RepID=A0A9X2GYQ5_9MICO|nr:hypothetical protein [Agromyces terreus]MCP2371077.1 MFS family permease [Agromyces terreus]
MSTNAPATTGADPGPTVHGSAPAPAVRSLRGYRRIAVIVLVVSLSITAVTGVVVLLSGEFDTLQSQVLTTTLLVATFSVVALCHLAVAGRPVRIVGYVGLAVSGLALVLGLISIWVPYETGLGDFLGFVGHAFGAAAIAALSLAQANLVLLLAGRRRTVIRAVLAVTLLAIAIVAVMLSLPLVSDWQIPGNHADEYWRWFGVVAIVDAFGTVLLPVLGLLMREHATAATAATPPRAEPVAASGQPDTSLDAALDRRIADLSARTGLDRTALMNAALDAFEAKGTPGA